MSTRGWEGFHPKPLDFEELLPRLELTIGQLARLAGVSVRQIGYWTSKGILEASNPKKRLYGHAAIRKALLVKQGLDQGFGLAEAAEEAAAAIEAETERAQRRETAVERGLDSYLLSTAEDLQELARRLRAQIPHLARLRNERERQVAVTKLEVVQFFAENPFTRDTAMSIACQVGRSVELVQAALDELTTDRAIAREVRSGQMICAASEPVEDRIGEGRKPISRRRSSAR